MDKLSFLKGLALGLAGKPLEFAPGKEPVPDAPEQPTAFFYGRVAKEGETPTHTFDGVDYVGKVAPDIYTVYTPELQVQYPYALILNRHYALFLELASEKPSFEGGILTHVYYPTVSYRDDDHTEWKYERTNTKDTYFVEDTLSYVWTNFDFSEAGLTFHDPIPIYE